MTLTHLDDTSDSPCGCHNNNHCGLNAVERGGATRSRPGFAAMTSTSEGPARGSDDGGKHHGSFGKREFQLAPTGSLARTGTPLGLPLRVSGRTPSGVAGHHPPGADAGPAHDPADDYGDHRPGRHERDIEGSAAAEQDSAGAAGTAAG